MRKITFFLFLFTHLGCLWAQFPGGVTSPELWFKTTPTSTDLNGTYQWTDYSGDSLVLRSYDARGASYGNPYTTKDVRFYNGHPALMISSAANILLKRTNLSQSTIIGAYAPRSDFDKGSLLYGLFGREGQAYYLSTNKVVHSNESKRPVFDYGESEGMDLMYSPNDKEPDYDTFRENSFRIAAYYNNIPPVIGIWGEKAKSVITLGDIYKPSDVNNNSTFSLTNDENRKFNGYIPELIVYNRFITPLERRRVDSYLSLKYGLTMPVSYIGSKGQLLWDYTENTDYNTRITGIYRDDISGLNQNAASTSYETSPYFSYIYDFYYQNNPTLAKSSEGRLLYIETNFREGEFPDGSYLIWGDNAQTITTKEEDQFAGLKVMNRKWLMRTNVSVPQRVVQAELGWNLADLIIDKTDPANVVIRKDSKAIRGTALTDTPLLAKDGSFGGNLLSATGIINLTFYTEDNHYGYHIGANGYIFKIEKGQLVWPQFGLAKIGTRLDIVKEGNRISLLENGVDNKHYIYVDNADAEKEFYGAIMIESPSLSISNFTHEGFVEKTNFVELSTFNDRATEFKDYTTNSYLLVDRSGSGEFKSGDVEYYKADAFNAARSKIIFNNVFWDTDGNGKDVFTFAYRPTAALSGEVQVTDSTCENDTPLNNGSIEFIVKDGLKGFSYLLKNKTLIEDEKTGIFFDKVKIDGLKGGIYDLTVQEQGGCNFSNNKKGTSVSNAVSGTYFTTIEGAFLEWTIIEPTTKGTVGFMFTDNGFSDPDAIEVNYGVYMDGFNLYSIANKQRSTTPFATIQPGDTIRIERTQTQMLFKVNNQQRTSSSIIAPYYTYGVVSIDSSSGEILNLKWDEMSKISTWRTNETMHIDYSDNARITKEVTLDIPCDVKSPSTESSITDSNEQLEIWNDTGGSTLKMRLMLDIPQAASFVIYSLNGNLVRKIDKQASTLHEESVEIGQSGIYIVKAITPTEEFSKKAIIK